MHLLILSLTFSLWFQGLASLLLIKSSYFSSIFTPTHIFTLFFFNVLFCTPIHNHILRRHSSPSFPVNEFELCVCERDIERERECESERERRDSVRKREERKTVRVSESERERNTLRVSESGRERNIEREREVRVLVHVHAWRNWLSEFASVCVATVSFRDLDHR